MSLARILLVAALVTGCVPSHRAVFGPVDAEINRRLGLGATAGTDPKVRAAVAMLLTHPLDADAAVRIAIANNRELQARYDELGIAAADIATATVLDPTDVDFSHKVALSGDGTETEIDAIQNITGLLQIPQRRAIASAGLAAVRARAVAATIELVAHVETTFYDVVAATQTLELRETAFAAASAAAELTERMHVAGNTTDLQLARDLDQREQARVELGRAQLEVEVTREQLNEALGLYGPDTVWTAAPRLPELPASAPALDQLETEAIVANLELVAVRADADAAAGRVGYARLRTWLPEIGIGASVSRRDSGEWEVGPAVRIGLPIFNQQQGPRARANAELRRARNLGGRHRDRDPGAGAGSAAAGPRGVRRGPAPADHGTTTPARGRRRDPQTVQRDERLDVRAPDRAPRAG
jgi:cobalt-zinc-cadmium efflux system outer membrane protein